MGGLVDGIKNILAVEESSRAEISMIVENAGGSNDKLRDSILDDPETDLLGAEDDPAIGKLVDDLPDEDLDDAKVQEVLESLI